ncbi:MAG: hypothetical protein ABFR97_03050 [Thermodesulfobacteriota bacterium]
MASGGGETAEKIQAQLKDIPKKLSRNEQAATAFMINGRPAR